MSWSAFAFCGLGLTAIAADVRAAEKPPAADVAAIRATAAAYREALEKGDLDAVRKAWTADGDIVDGWGNLLSAKDASADVTLPGTKVPIEGSFTAVWVRQDGTWKIAGLRESERPAAPSAAMLEDLDWMVGEWILETSGEAATDDVPPMEMTVRWDAARTFLVRDARLKSRDPDGETAVVELHQRIGWDPLVGRVRSWSFSTDGSRGEATWFRDGDSWVARESAVLPDGKQIDSVNIYSHDGVGRCVWRIMPEPLASTEGLPTRATWVRNPGSNAK